MRVSILLAIIGVAVSGCGSNPNVPTQITIPSSSIEAIVTQLVKTIAVGLASGASHAGSSSMQSVRDARPLDARDNVTVPLNGPYDAQVGCAAGGTVHVSGTITGSLTADADAGTLFGQVVGRGFTSINSWMCDGGYVINTAPEISDSTTITVTGPTRFSVDSTSGGGFSFQAVPGAGNPVVDCLYNSHVSFDNNTLVAAWSATVACQGANSWSGSGSISLR